MYGGTVLLGGGLRSLSAFLVIIIIYILIGLYLLTYVCQAS